MSPDAGVPFAGAIHPGNEAADGVRALLKPLLPYLEREGVTDLVVNRPGEVGVHVKGSWEWNEESSLDFNRLMAIARGLAGTANQQINQKTPACAAVLPDGQRAQILIPPATLAGHVSITIRRPPSRLWSLDELKEGGTFQYVRKGGYWGSEQAGQEVLSALYQQQDWMGFLAKAVAYRQNIVISGATGSGKTSLARALLAHIPDHERIITGEDTHELVGLPQRNKVHLLYPQDAGQSATTIGAKDLMVAALRMRPDRILFPELRDGTAYYFLRSVASGHPGVITTIHASSCDVAWETLTLLVRECPEARGLAREDIGSLLRAMVDVVVQMEVRGDRHEVIEVQYTRLIDGGKR